MPQPGPRTYTGKYLYLYMDYHNVLDCGYDKLREMATFLKRLDEISTGLFRTLISFGGQARNEETMQELCQAGVTKLLDQIVFTRQRTSQQPTGGSIYYRPGTTVTHQYVWSRANYPAPVTHEYINYFTFTGGKDEYILRVHAGRYSDMILFVDDKAATLHPVCEPVPWTVAPRLCGIEMSPWGTGFQTTRGARYEHCTSLPDLLVLIKAWKANGGVLSSPNAAPKALPKRRRRNDSEDAEATTKARRRSELENADALHLTGTLLANLATLRIRSNNPSRKEVLKAYEKIMMEEPNEENKRRIQRAFQAVWSKVNGLPEAH